MSAEDVCADETYTKTCGEGEVIVMTSAEYGRMPGGTCIDRIGPVGCRSDIIQIAHSHCSGRWACKWQVIQKDLNKATTGCDAIPKDYPRFVTVTSRCQQGKLYGPHSLMLSLVSTVSDVYLIL